MPAASRSMPSAFWPGRPLPGPQPELGQVGVRRPAVVGEVVERRDQRRPTDDRIVAIRGGRGTSPAGPACQSWRWSTSTGRPSARSASSAARANKPEPPRVVGVVPGVVAVEPVPIERRRVVDEPQPIAVGRDVDDRHRRRAGPCARIRHGDASSRPGSRRAAGPARPDSAAGRRRPGLDAVVAGTRPMARASASTTSARPPVLAHGSHSADRKATRSPTVAW